MPTDRWRQIEELYHAAIMFPPGDRSGFLIGACAGDDALRREVESLLVREYSATAFLSVPALDIEAQAIAEGPTFLTAGQRLGPYTIRSPLGHGGMGEVYRARDSKLARDVAIKVLPHLFASDPDRLARFEREARILAALNHPHIGAIYGLEESDGVRGLVLELIEGPTLTDRLVDGALPIEEALAIASQIAEALEAAHEQGITHRDLKPANIKFTAGGAVKVLDFGLAKTTVAERPDRSETRPGAILGTTAYMSPEQTRGRIVDKRTDIWAFGCVLYEMLTGGEAFTGETPSDTMAAILNKEPDWTTLPASTPRAVRRLLRRCLSKDPKERLRDIGDVRLELRGYDDEDDGARAGTRRFRWTNRRTAAAAVAFIAVTVVSAALGAFFFRSASRSNLPERSLRFSVSPPPGSTFADSGENTFLALSPDGSQLAFVANEPGGTTRIWLRHFSALDPHPVTGTDTATSVFWSPDGRSLAFFAEHKLKRVDLPGNAIVTLCDVTQAEGMTGTWGSEGRILFAPVSGTTIFSVAAAGGRPVAEVVLNESKDGVVQWPAFLSDGKRFVYIARPPDRSGRKLMLAEPGHAPRQILSVSSNVEWVDPDYFVFAMRDGTLVAQRFDLSTGRAVGDPSPIAQSVDYGYGPGRAMFAVSRNGTLAYQAQQTQRLIWTDRTGKELDSIGPPGNYQALRLSPDGERLLFDRMQGGAGTYDLWIADLRRRVEMRLTSDPGNEVYGVWLPGGRAIAFAADRGGPPHLFRKDLVNGAVDELLPAGRRQFPTDVSPDGTTLLFVERTDRANWSLSSMALTGSHARSSVLGSPFDESGARFSPDGRYIAFTSDESGSGRQDVYIAPFPSGAKVRVSTAEGGDLPRWSADSRELFYLSRDRRVVAVPVRTQPSLEIGHAVSLFTLPGLAGWFQFDVSADGKRFIAVAQTAETPVIVVQHWTSDVGR